MEELEEYPLLHAAREEHLTARDLIRRGMRPDIAEAIGYTGRTA